MQAATGLLPPRQLTRRPGDPFPDADHVADQGLARPGNGRDEGAIAKELDRLLAHD